MEDIAVEAGLRKASLYYYFPTKEDLFHAVLDGKHTEFQRQVGRILAGDGLVSARISAYVDARHQFFNQLLSLNTIDFRSAARNSAAHREIFIRYARQELRWLHALFSEGRRDGEFNTESPQKLAEAFLHIMQGLRARFFRDHEDGHADSSELAQFRRESHMVTQILLNGICTKKPKSALRVNRNIIARPMRRST